MKYQASFQAKILLNVVPVVAVEVVEAGGEVSGRDLPGDREQEDGRALREAHLLVCLRVCFRVDRGYSLTGYGDDGFVTSFTISTVYYCNPSNLALFNWG